MVAGGADATETVSEGGSGTPGVLTGGLAEGTPGTVKGATTGAVVAVFVEMGAGEPGTLATLATGFVEALPAELVSGPPGALKGAIIPSVVVGAVLVGGTVGPLEEAVDDALDELTADDFIDAVVERLPPTLEVVVSDGRSRVERTAVVVGSLGVAVLVGGMTDEIFSDVGGAIVDVSVVLGSVGAVDFSVELVGGPCRHAFDR